MNNVVCRHGIATPQSICTSYRKEAPLSLNTSQRKMYSWQIGAYHMTILLVNSGVRGILCVIRLPVSITASSEMQRIRGGNQRRGPTSTGIHNKGDAETIRGGERVLRGSVLVKLHHSSIPGPKSRITQTHNKIT